jgi:hypothetical protein
LTIQITFKIHAHEILLIKFIIIYNYLYVYIFNVINKFKYYFNVEALLFALYIYNKIEQYIQCRIKTFLVN